jgi:hypothetical protein
MYFCTVKYCLQNGQSSTKVGVLVHGVEVTGQVQKAQTNSQGFSTFMHKSYTNRSIGRALGWSSTGTVTLVFVDIKIINSPKTTFSFFPNSNYVK